MDGKKIGYWLTTGLVALAMVGGGGADIALTPEIAESLEHLGYPAYFGRMLGVWKVLGGLAILAPGLGRVKEWAYFGIFIDLSSAFISHLAVGDGPERLAPPLVVAVALVASYLLRPESRRLV